MASVMGITHIWRGDALAKTGNFREALDCYRKGMTCFAALEKESPPDLLPSAVGHARIAAVFALMGKRQEASAAYRKALAMLETLTANKDVETSVWYTLADVYFGMGEVSERQAAWSEARDWYQKSGAAWRRISNPGAMSPAGFACGNPQAVARAIGLCDSALTKLAAKKR